MDEIHARVERVIEELSGNEALFEMLDTDAATEMLNWGIEMGTSIVEGTEGMDEPAAEEVLGPRLKAVRQTLRSAGNWAAGQYIDPDSRVQLREKLWGNFRLIYGEETYLPSPEKMDELLNQVDAGTHTPHQLILMLKELVAGSAKE